MTSREVADLAATLAVEVDAAVARLAAHITTEMDPYRAGIVSTEQLRASLRQNLLYMLDHIGGGSATDLSVARETGTARGRTGAPLPELLKAYRLGFSELWRMLVEHARRRGAVSVEALIDAATDIWTLADEYSDAVTDAYREAQADTLYERARHRAALIEAVLTGQTGDHGTLWEIAERLRIPYVARVTGEVDLRIEREHLPDRFSCVTHLSDYILFCQNKIKYCINS